MPAADATLPRLALSAAVLDRRGDLRADPGLLPRLLADPATRVLRLVGDRVAVRGPRRRPAPRGDHPAGDRRRGSPRALPRGGGRHRLRGGGRRRPRGCRRRRPRVAHPAPGGRRPRRPRGVGLRDDPRPGELAPGARALPALRHRDRTRRSPAGSAAARPTGASTTPAPTWRSSWRSSTPTTASSSRAARASGATGCRCSPASSSRARPSRPPSPARWPRRWGCEVTDVTYLGDQPWPFPSSLMLGFTARALGHRPAPAGGGDRGRPVVHPRRARRGAGRRVGGGVRAHLDLAADHRALVRRAARRPGAPAALTDARIRRECGSGRPGGHLRTRSRWGRGVRRAGRAPGRSRGWWRPSRRGRAGSARSGCRR